MNNSWNGIKKLLVIRADNMGDLLMSVPAIRALKESFGCEITVLTSSMAAAVCPLLPEIDDTIIYDLPWIKSPGQARPETLFEISELLRQRSFDACVIFTVYSQNPLPAAMLAYLAAIPRRLAYCRENPYQLLTDWVPDREPYEVIHHQVRRDLLLVEHIGAKTADQRLSVRIGGEARQASLEKLSALGIDKDKPWLIVHAGVSEDKRKYPEELWIETARGLVQQAGIQVVFSGSPSERELTTRLQRAVGQGAYSAGGMLNVEEFAALISEAPLLVSVNTGPIHLAAATGTPVVVLYALTNPQHLPWAVSGRVLPFSIPVVLKSSNEVIRFTDKTFFKELYELPQPADVISAVQEVLSGRAGQFPELIC